MNVTSATTEAAPADQERLARILDEYLVAIEQGQSITPAELLAKYPADAPRLRGYLSGLNLFHAAAFEPAKDLLSNDQRAPGIPAALQTIGDYRLVRELGRGGMGVVYEAWQLSLRRRVALKVLPFTSARDAKQLGRFKNEAQAAAQIQHPNIVPVHAIGEDGGTNYYVMQLIDGQSLASLLHALRATDNPPCDATVPNNALTYNSQRLGSHVEPSTHRPHPSQPMRAADTADHIGVVARLGVQAAEALHAAHEYGIVHRDVKPSNLLLDDHGKLWVTDFGLARCRDDQGLTQSGDVLGTMRYMSPEQAQGRLSLIDHRTDVYSLGLTLYELATLRHPDDDAGDAAILFDRQRAAPKPLRHWNRHIANDFQTIVMKCLAEYPQERFGTAQELAADLQRFLEGRPILASPPSIASRLSKWAKRRRGLVYATAAVLLVAMLSIAISSVKLSRQRLAASADHEHIIKERLHDESLRLQKLYARVSDELAAIPGAEAVTAEMLHDGIHDYERFVREVGDDPLFATDVAAANGALGALEAKLGNRSAAVQAHTKAKEAWEYLLKQEPNNAELARNLALSLNNLGLLIADDGRQQDAVDLLTQAVDLQRSLVAGDPDSVIFATDLATTHCNLGLIHMKLLSNDAAAREFGLAIQAPLVNSATTSEARRVLAASFNNLAGLEASANPSAAANAYQRAIALERELIKSAPGNRYHQIELARAYSNLGALASKNKDWKNAENCFHDAILIQDKLANLSPQVAVYRADLAISNNNLGMAQFRSDRLTEAESSFQKAIDLLAVLLAPGSADPELLSRQGSVWNNLGMLRDKQQRTAEAAKAYENAIEFQSAAWQHGSRKEVYRALLSRHYFNFARALETQAQFDDALQTILKRKELWADDSERLFSVAQELVLLQHQVAGQATREKLRDACVEAAVATLREALDKGLSADHLHDASLAELSDFDSFRRLLDERKVGLSSPASKTPPEISRVN